MIERQINSWADAIVQFFENEKEKVFFTSRNVSIGEITVEHLLTMRAGFEFNESVFYPAGSHPVYDQSDWVKAILSLSLKDTPGEKYNYSTPQTQCLQHKEKLGFMRMRQPGSSRAISNGQRSGASQLWVRW